MPLGRGLNSLIPDKKTMAPLVMGLAMRPAVAGGAAVQTIAVDLIDPNPYQPRKEFDETALQSLAESIKAYGVIQPIVVSSATGGRYHLVVGERRLRAAKLAGLREIPAHIRSTKDQDKLELALIENIQREDLNPLEQGAAFKLLMDEFGLRQADVARRTGKSRQEILYKIRILELPDEIKTALRNGEIAYRKARALSRLLEHPDVMMRVWHESQREMVSNDDLERATIRQRPPEAQHTKKMLNPIILEKQRALEEVFGTKVFITHTKKKSTIAFTFFSDEEFYKTIERMLSLRD